MSAVRNGEGLDYQLASRCIQRRLLLSRSMYVGPKRVHLSQRSVWSQ